METQICKKCGKDKLLTTDYFAQGKNKRNGIEIFYWYKTCKICDRDRVLAKSIRYKKKNRKKIADAQKLYHKANKENDSNTKKEWYQENKESVKKRVKNNLYNRRKNDVSFRLKESISRRVWKVIVKGGKSVSKYLPYSVHELKVHLEKLFQPWMTWDNYGTYRADIWDDSDPTTWTWQIDHIIPHSKFHYSSMEDQEFKNCWALSNLRPYSAKQNIIDGDRT
jgi:hypothetical protein